MTKTISIIGTPVYDQLKHLPSLISLLDHVKNNYWDAKMQIRHISNTKHPSGPRYFTGIDFWIKPTQDSVPFVTQITIGPISEKIFENDLIMNKAFSDILTKITH